MGVKNDSRRAHKKLRRQITLDILPEQVFLDWPSATDLGFARRTGESTYKSVEQPGVKRLGLDQGLHVSREAYHAAVNSAPHYVRRRLNHIT